MHYEDISIEDLFILKLLFTYIFHIPVITSEGHVFNQIS